MPAGESLRSWKPYAGVMGVLLLSAACLTTGCVPFEGQFSSPPTPVATSSPPAVTSPMPVPAGTARVLLDTLEVKGRAPTTGYDRDQFGQRWLDTDRNGCDTRNDTLARDLTDVVRSGPCRVLSGTLQDPLTGTTIRFQRGEGTSELVQIDHVVSLSDAWQKGAQQLTVEQRAAFANDPRNVLAVDGAANAAKGDGDAATWLPPNRSFRCAFVAHQVTVKAAYGLWITPAERDAIAGVLATCPTQPALPPSGATPAPVGTPSTVPQPTVTEPGAVVVYADCEAARAAGAAPVSAGDPGYARNLDGDGDGVACE